MHGTIDAPRQETRFAPTIYHEDWWLDIASDGKWWFVKHTAGGRLLGWLPYVRASRLGLPVSRMPHGTPFLGPALCPAIGDDSRAHMRITRSLLSQLPDFACFSQKMHRGVADLLPYQMEGFSVGVQFTFETSGDPDTVWRGMRRRTREVVASAERSLHLDCDLEIGPFVTFVETNHLIKFGAPMRGWGTFQALARAALERRCGTLLGARDRKGRLIAAIMCVFDRSTTYYFLSSRTADAGNGAVSFLLWHAIRDALDRGTTFDFNGVGDAGSVAFFAGFSPRPSPRYTITKTTLAFRLLREIRRTAVSPDNHFTNCL